MGLCREVWLSEPVWQARRFARFGWRFVAWVLRAFWGAVKFVVVAICVMLGALLLTRSPKDGACRSSKGW